MSGSAKENSNDDELNHFGKIAKRAEKTISSEDFSVNPIKLNSNADDLNHVGQIAETKLSKELGLIPNEGFNYEGEYVSHSDNDEKTEDAFKLGLGEGMKSGDFNVRYQSALKARAKQQMLLGWVLDTKYS